MRDEPQGLDRAMFDLVGVARWPWGWADTWRYKGRLEEVVTVLPEHASDWETADPDDPNVAPAGGWGYAVAEQPEADPWARLLTAHRQGLERQAERLGGPMTHYLAPQPGVRPDA